LVASQDTNQDPHDVESGEKAEQSESQESEKRLEPALPWPPVLDVFHGRNKNEERDKQETQSSNKEGTPDDDRSAKDAATVRSPAERGAVFVPEGGGT